jgi:hypothetical protein
VLLLEWTKDLVNHFWYTAEVCNTQEEYSVSKMKLNYEFRKQIQLFGFMLYYKFGLENRKKTQKQQTKW